MLPGFLETHPDIRVEIMIDEGLTDLVSSRYDAGIRFGEKVAKDMIAVRISSEVRFVTVGSPAYFAHHSIPKTPQDLAKHRCINYRFITSGGLYLWEFEQDGRSFQLRVDGPLVFNDSDLILSAVLAGQGIGYLLEDQIVELVAEGRLIQVLAEWCPTAPGYYLYHANRRQIPPALAALVDTLRIKLDNEQNLRLGH